MSQTDSPRPSSFAAPSIWSADVAAPQPKPAGKRSGPRGPELLSRSGFRVPRACGAEPAFNYHRFWAQADVAMADADYGNLFPSG
nr:glycoside hydrolase family 48 protein [Micromonospora kangleipakensis]